MDRLVLLMIALTVGCGSDDDAQASNAAPTAPPAAIKTTPKPVLRATLFDADGKLLPSSDKVSALVLPQGLTAVRTEGRVHDYDGVVAANHYVNYFRTHVFTSEIQPMGLGAIFRGATIRDAGEHIRTKVDISVWERSGGREAKIQIREIPPPSQPSGSPEARKADLEAYLKRLD